MSCNISRGRLEGCKDGMGGVQAIYFYTYTSLQYIDIIDNKVINFLEDTLLFKYELKGANTYVETINTNRDNGTTFYTQTLTVVLKKLTNEMTKQLELLAKGKNRIFVHMNNGECLFMGLIKCVDLTSSTINSGSGMGDLYGYNLTFTAMEKNPAIFVEDSMVDDPWNGLQNTPIIDIDGSIYTNGQFTPIS